MAAPRKAANPRSGRATVRPIKASERSLTEIISTDVEEVDSIPVFSIDGQVYSMPGAISVSFALEAIDVMGQRGELAAMAWLLPEVLGQEAYDALKTCKALKPEQLKSIMDRVSEHVMGQLEDLGK